MKINKENNKVYYKSPNARRWHEIGIAGNCAGCEYRCTTQEIIMELPDDLHEVDMNFLPKTMPSMMRIIDRSYK